MAVKVSYDRASDEIQKQIEKQVERIVRDLDKGFENIAEETAEEMKAKAPRSDRNYRGSSKTDQHYADAFYVQKDKKNPHVWNIKNYKYRLAHLLNNGHALKNGGWVNGDKHLDKATEKAMTMVRELKGGIRR